MATFLVPLVLLLLLATAILYMRLAHGPISLQFLAQPIERILTAEMAGGGVAIDDVVVRLTPGKTIEFRLSNVRLTDADGASVATAPMAALGMSFDALMSGRVAASKVELINPRILMVYTPDDGLAFRFSRPGEAPLPAARPQPVRPGATPPADAHGSADAAPDAAAASGQLRRIDLARMLADATLEARRGRAASSHLREIGLRNATLIIAHGQERSLWRVPELTVDLAHMKRRSVISGKATIVSGRGPWSLKFRAEDGDRSQRIDIKVAVRDLVPHAIAAALPPLAILDGFDLPVDGDASFTLARSGEFIGASMQLEVQRGRIHLPWLGDASFPVDAGQLNLSYDDASKRIAIAPSTLRWGQSRLTLKGGVLSERATNGEDLWVFNLEADEGTLAAEEFGVDGMPVQVWRASGHASQRRRFLQLNEFRVRAGGGELTLAGVIDAPTAGDRANVAFNGQIGAMPIGTLKAFWPRALANGARTWIGAHLTRGSITGGTLKWLAGSYLGRQAVAEGNADQRLSVTLEARDVEVQPLPTMPPVTAPRALVRLEGDAIEVSFPEATAAVAPGKAIAMKAGRFTAVDIFSEKPRGEIAFRAAGSLGTVLDVLDRPPLGIAREAGLPQGKFDGKVEGNVRLTMPLIEELPASQVKIEAKARITDGRASNIVGSWDVTGATVDVDVNDRAVDVRGDIILSGVLAKLSWQRIFDAESKQQPPMRLTAVLDNSDRNQLGLDVNHIVQGDIPVVLTIDSAGRIQPTIHLRADLTNTEMILQSLAWRKPPGRSTHLEFDIVQARNVTQLDNFKVIGDNIAIDGVLRLGADNKLRDFEFPSFTLDVVTQLSMRGSLKADNILDVHVKGRHYEGREFFRSLFSVGALAEQPRPAKSSRAGLDLSAEFDTVGGYSDVTLRNLKVKASTRGDKLVSLDARGRFDSGEPLAAVLQNVKNQPRRLLADSTDAGQAMRLIGFYPNMQSGRVRLEVNLDGRGPAEKTGRLWVEKFRVLGDPIISEVISSGEASQAGRRKVVREVFEFDNMYVPFSIGQGQFVLEDAYARGALIGASIRGKVDFRARRMNLGGTYIPLQGLNNVLHGVPLFGQILSGPRGEGIFGITFAVQGAMSNPQVIVNPLSLVAPGIFREMFQMSPMDPRVTPREERSGSGAGGAARASSTQAPARRGQSGSGQGEILGGWSAEQPPAKDGDR